MLEPSDDGFMTNGYGKLASISFILLLILEKKGVGIEFSSRISLVSLLFIHIADDLLSLPV